jgi:hypothetical protein
MNPLYLLNVVAVSLIKLNEILKRVSIMVKVT